MQCWEYKKCGREPGGDKVSELGICPASIAETANGINNGINGGRICWAIVGTMCDGSIQGAFTEKCGTCLNCDFMKLVRKQEGVNAKIFVNSIVA